MREVDLHILDKIPDKTTSVWNLFFKKELIDVTKKRNNLSTSSSNKLMWTYIKSIIRDKECINKFIDITNACIDLEHWPSHFKTSMTVVISKPNKISFKSSRSYYSIVLLNTIVKIVDDGLGFYFSLVIFILFYFSFSFLFYF